MSLIRNIILALGLIIAASTPAWADANSERFVQTNAALVLETLADPTLDTAGRTEKFSEYMKRFSDQRRIAYFVLGKYRKRFTKDELARFRDAFDTYSLTTYETQFDQYRGGDIQVTGSQESRDGKYSIVNTVVSGPNDERLDVRWRLLVTPDDYQIVDVGLNLDGNLLWLAIEQRAQFINLLDNTNGSADALIAKLEELTARLREGASGAETSTLE